MVSDAAKDKAEKREDQDVVFVQDVGFTVKITAPGVEPFDILVSLFLCFHCFLCLKSLDHIYNIIFLLSFLRLGIKHGDGPRNSSIVDG